jgi:protease PrsW
VMIEEADGAVKVDPGAVHAAFAELAGLQRALGRSTSAALNALLPFSRNDYWELSELKQRLGRG